MIVHLFGSAEEFLQSPDVSDTACLITDVHMAGMSGIELQRALIAQDQRMPITSITAFPKETIWPRLLKTGAVCRLSKPFDEQTLLQLPRYRSEEKSGCGCHTIGSRSPVIKSAPQKDRPACGSRNAHCFSDDRPRPRGLELEARLSHPLS
jgi:CheY-like chemotaxis protein